jgi:hypothetical protein
MQKVAFVVIIYIRLLLDAPVQLDKRTFLYLSACCLNRLWREGSWVCTPSLLILLPPLTAGVSGLFPGNVCRSRVWRRVGGVAAEEENVESLVSSCL